MGYWNRFFVEFLIFMLLRFFKINGCDIKWDVGCWKLKRFDGWGKILGVSYGILSYKIVF